MAKFKLSDLFNLQMGKTPSRDNPEYWGDPYPWVSISDLKHGDKYICTSKEHITERAIGETGIKLVPANTLIMSFKLSMGKTAITSTPLYTNEAIMAFIDRGTSPVCIDFFYHMLANMDWQAGAHRAAMGPTVNKTSLSEMQIEVPPFERQCSIAAILDEVDSLITLFEEQICQLEALVKSEFATEAAA